MPQAKYAKPLSICLVHDDRIGHQKQLKGLENQLIKQTSCTTQWIDAEAANKLNAQTLHFDICIGAGHKTHWPLWRLAKKQRAFSVVLMTPSLPKFLFDAVICPRHDEQKKSARVFMTKGPINTIQHETEDAEPDEMHNQPPQHNLVLLGGPSKHFNWNSEQILASVKQIIEHDTELPWLLSPSRRTPEPSINIVKSGLPNLDILDLDCDIDQVIREAKQVWVSADSSNMIYEALSAGKPTGVIELVAHKKRFKGNRLSKELTRLFREGHLMHLSSLGSTSETDSDSEPQSESGIKTGFKDQQSAPLNEAERAAQWLLQRYQSWLTKRGEQNV